MKFSTYAVTLEFAEPILGTVPKNRDVYQEYIQAKAREMLENGKTPAPPEGSGVAVLTTTALAAEVETIEEIEQKGWTGFHVTEDGFPFVYDYSVKANLKETGNVLKDQLRIKNLRSKIEDHVFIRPRRIRFHRPGHPTDYVMPDSKPLERPLRAMTAQGPRVSLVRSDQISGAHITFFVVIVEHTEVKPDVIEELFHFGEFRGLGQWRNGGYGRFNLVDFTSTER